MQSVYVLIDYENVQPKELTLLHSDQSNVKVKVFLGASQSKVPVDLAKAMQPLGAKVEYVQIEGAGSNALDFHIAYYIGDISAREPAASFCVISRDTGFDPLLRHVNTRGIVARRSASLSAISSAKPGNPAEMDSQIATAVAHLTKLKAAKPRAEKTLRGTLHTLFKKALSDAQLTHLFETLCIRGYVRVEGARVSYDLPDGK